VVIGLAVIAILPPIFGNNSFVLAPPASRCMPRSTSFWIADDRHAGIFSLAALRDRRRGRLRQLVPVGLLSTFRGGRMWLTGGVRPGVRVFITIPAIRLEGFYYAMLTVGITELCRVYVIQDQTLGSANGLWAPTRSFPIGCPIRRPDPGILSGILLLIGALTLYRVVNGQRLGRLPARRARAAGGLRRGARVNYRSLRIQVFLISSAALGGVGAFYATLAACATPDCFSLDQLLLLLAMVVSAHRHRRRRRRRHVIVTLFDKVFIGSARSGWC